MKRASSIFLAGFFAAWSFAALAQGQQAPPPPMQGDQTMDQGAGAPPPPDGQAYPGQPNGPDGQPNDASPENDPPGRVARLQYMTGQVSIQPHGTEDWVQGAVNRPLTTADNVWADKNSRAELSLGSAVMRISDESSLTLSNIGDNTTQVQLHQGVLDVHVRRIFEGETYEVDTPNQAFTILKTGDYRFDVDSKANSTVVTVWQGEGESTGQGPALRLHSQQQVRFGGDPASDHQVLAAPGPDNFDRWCQERDQVQDNSQSEKYVGPGMVGADDLDQYGQWKQDAQYGAVWTPTGVDSDWAPYHNGHWAYIAPWGWTWVDDAPWGFAPFHYGRWVYGGWGWGWAPGPYYVRPWYAPALVAWFGGPGWGLGFGFGWGFGGGYGWCPLGWREPFHPWYRTSNVYIHNVNINHTTNVNNGVHGTMQYANMNRPGGFTAVSKGTLEKGQPVARNAAHVSASAIHSAPALSRVNATPGRGATLGPKSGMRAAAPPKGTLSRPTVSRASAMASTPHSGAMAAQNQGARPSANPFGSHAAQGSSQVRPTESASGGRYVPRPPSGYSGSNAAANRGFSNSNAGSAARSEPTQMAHNSVPRPPAGTTFSSHNTPTYSGSGSSYSRPAGGANSVPRPTGPVQAAPRQYSSSSYGSQSGSRSYNYGGSSSRSYGYPSSGSPHSYGYPSSSSRGYSYPSSGSHSYGGSYGGYSGRSSGSYGGYSGHNSGSYGGYSGHSSGGYSGGSSHGSSGGSHGGGSSHGGGGGHSGGGHSGGHR